MVENSNIYHGYCIQIRRICHPNSRDKDWSDIDLNEFKAFLGVSILMGIIKVPHYWYLSFKLKYLFILLQLVLYIYVASRRTPGTLGVLLPCYSYLFTAIMGSFREVRFGHGMSEVCHLICRCYIIK